MATATKTYNFLGSSENWSWTTVTGVPASAGYANNRLEFAGEIGRNKTTNGYFAVTGTFASIFGIADTAVVNGYSAASFLAGCSIFNVTDYYYEGDVNGSLGALVINDGTTRQLIANQSTYSATGQTHSPSVNPGITGLSLAATTSITIYLYIAGDTANNSSAQAGGYVDDISITVDYTDAGATIEGATAESETSSDLESAVNLANVNTAETGTLNSVNTAISILNSVSSESASSISAESGNLIGNSVIQESSVPSDSNSITLVTQSSLTESASLSEDTSSVIIRVISAEFVETTSLVDSYSTISIANGIITEVSSLLANESSLKITEDVISEVNLLIDEGTAGKIGLSNVSDTTTIQDSLTADIITEVIGIVSEIESISDESTAINTALVELQDSTTLVDSNVSGKVTNVSVTEQENVSDTAITSSTSVISGEISEASTLSDNCANSLITISLIEETGEINDSLLNFTIFVVSVQEVEGANVALSSSGIYNTNISEILTYTESIGVNSNVIGYVIEQNLGQDTLSWIAGQQEIEIINITGSINFYELQGDILRYGISAEKSEIIINGNGNN